MRDKITMNMSGMDLAVVMSEGNPGAMSVLSQLMLKIEDLTVILGLDDMNIRGSQIWVAFKDFAGEDIEKLKEAVKSRNKDLVDIVNKECASYGEIAVTSGASFTR
jgi:hypothetical protein